MLAHSLLGGSTLKDADEKKIKRVIPKASNKIIADTVARLYIAYPDPAKWQYTGLSGAICLVNDLVGHTFYLKLVDITGNHGVLWDQELFVDFQYNQDRTFFHSFEIEECLCGLLFEDKKEAAHFYHRLNQRHKHASKETLNNKAALPRQKQGVNAPTRPPPAPGPRGDINSLNGGGGGGIAGAGGSARRQRQRQIYYDDQPPVEWRQLYRDLAQQGITEDMIAANTPFIKDFIRRQGGPLVGLEPPLPRKFAPKDPFSGQLADGDGNTSAAARRAPPPPPPPPPSAPHVEPMMEGDGPVAESAMDSVSPGPENGFMGFLKRAATSRRAAAVYEQGMDETPAPPSPMATAPAVETRSEASSTVASEPSQRPTAPQEAPPAPVRHNLPPPPPFLGSKVDDPSNRPSSRRAEEGLPPALPSRNNAPPPSRASAPPPAPPPRGAAMVNRVPVPGSGGSASAPPPPPRAPALPARREATQPPASAHPPPMPARPVSRAPETPPLPPNRPTVAPAVEESPQAPQRRTMAEQPARAPPAPAPPAPAPPAPAPAPTPASARSSVPDAPPLPRRDSVQPPAVAPPLPNKSAPAAPSAPPQAPPLPSLPPSAPAAPPAAPPAEAPAAAAPPAPPPLPNNPPAAPPLPVHPPSAPPLPEHSAPGGVPAPPPLPSQTGGNDGPDAAPAAPPAVAGDPGMSALLSSITQAGLGTLKKTNRSKDESAAPAPQRPDSGSGGGSGGSGAPGDAQASLASSLAAALSVRKGQVLGSDEEDENDDDWD